MKIYMQLHEDLYAVTWRSICSYMKICMQLHEDLYAVTWRSICSFIIRRSDFLRM